MSVLNHPLFIFYKETIQTKTHLYIITELVKGKDLFEYVREYGAIKEDMAAKVVRQLILGVKHLHDVGIVHRDLKPENIMLVLERNKKEAESVKIIDFGFSHYRASLDNL
jgi:serine/threonine protein kinase